MHPSLLKTMVVWNAQNVTTKKASIPDYKIKDGRNEETILERVRAANERS